MGCGVLCINSSIVFPFVINPDSTRLYSCTFGTAAEAE